MNDPISLFFKNVENFSDQLAVVDDNLCINYGDLGFLVRKIASEVVESNKSPRVLIYLPQGSDAYAAMLGVLFAGGYYSPLNINAPFQRNLDIFDQFQPNIIICSKKGLDFMPDSAPGLKLIEIDNLSFDPLSKRMIPHKLAYVIFTSGSTGKPKGVKISNSALSHYITWSIGAMSVVAGDRWSQHPNIAFDLSVLDIFGALCGGATLYPLVSKKDRLFPANFIKKHKLTIWNSVPSVIDLMDRSRQVVNENFSSLRMLTFCGEPLLARHLEVIFSANQELVIHNTYGPTESTVSCTCINLRVENYQRYCNGSVALGEAIPGMSIELINGTNINEGEIILIGPQLSVGYWNNDPETLRSFIKNKRGVLTYKTGDWAVRIDGQLYFRKRIDNQVKVRGNRVELGGIDVALNKLGYKNVCTVHIDSDICSFIETSEKIHYSELRSILKSQLPEYEVPTFIQTVDCFPRSVNDKINVKELIKYCHILNKKKRGHA